MRRKIRNPVRVGMLEAFNLEWAKDFRRRSGKTGNPKNGRKALIL
ncbi:hypothetical protein SBA1_190005 [Candidatus Sulfotelmatobacter kueseliae]|uniref:Uncharacterized protein n=1 Tax=Candidatus Sulfotelmatobacter kueseliae TaxID=2042962 RepID=A0A2U3KE08_9BACT|nr:hypothetical protein SBA1_190005 [Candidatus Sulfotelmatobacter kueseliae]